jgi:conjugal transfer pilus assembly protein TraK
LLDGPGPGVLKYATEPAELFIICGEAVYHVIAVPKAVPSKTVFLSEGMKTKIKHNLDYFSGMSHEEKLIKINEQVYRNEIPDSYTVATPGSKIDIFRELLVTYVRRIEVPGEGFIAKEYFVTLKPNVPELTVKEKNFLVPELTQATSWIMLDKHNIKQGDTGRLIIIEKKGGDAGSIASLN